MGLYEDFDEQKQFACRVIADHARTTAFAIADGILPGNEGRNYVLRKIMRRAIYHGREHLGFEGLFFHKVCDFVVGQMNDAYPELETQREFIGKMVRLEEERFGNTLTVGLKKLNELIAFEKSQRVDLSKLEVEKPVSNRSAAPTSKIIAQLNDTYGLPIDLIYVVLSNNKSKILDYETIDGVQHADIIYVQNLTEDEFKEIIQREIQKLQESSNIGKTQQNEKINPIYKVLERQGFASNFHGYELTKVEDAKVVAIVKGDEKVDELEAGEEGLIVLDETPFYAESGGQVGDRGDLFNQNAQITVLDTFAPIAGIVLHKSKVKSGIIKVGDVVTATVDEEKRDATRRNHTATHLVHAALKEVLGTHVKQAGSVVAPNYLRFDFTHYQAMSDAELQEIEDLVNLYILQNEPVATDLMSIDDAMKSGAVAMFGEKYGSDVRVLSVGGGEFSKELCGGTHVRATGDIGLFKITADEAIASGVRRIRAITGFDAFKRFRDDEYLPRLMDEQVLWMERLGLQEDFNTAMQKIV
jgi:alanyl-tRNA synthetase